MRYIPCFAAAIVLLPSLLWSQQPPPATQPMQMSEGMMMRCRMMMQATVDPFDPQSILAVRESLDLSDEQAQQLEALTDAARQQAQALLTDAQRQKLQALPTEPRTSMDMHHRMMQMMRQQRDGRQMSCPMMNMMGDAQPAGATTRPAQAPMHRPHE